MFKNQNTWLSISVNTKIFFESEINSIHGRMISNDRFALEFFWLLWTLIQSIVWLFAALKKLLKWKFIWSQWASSEKVAQAFFWQVLTHPLWTWNSSNAFKNDLIPPFVSFSFQQFWRITIKNRRFAHTSLLSGCAWRLQLAGRQNYSGVWEALVNQPLTLKTSY